MIRSSKLVALGSEEELMGFLRRPSPKECPAILREPTGATRAVGANS